MCVCVCVEREREKNEIPGQPTATDIINFKSLRALKLSFKVQSRR